MQRTKMQMKKSMTDNMRKTKAYEKKQDVTIVACMTGALWAKHGERDISPSARRGEEKNKYFKYFCLPLVSYRCILLIKLFALIFFVFLFHCKSFRSLIAAHIRSLLGHSLFQ